MIEELKTWLHKQRDYYLDQMNNDNLKKFGPLEMEWLVCLVHLYGKVSFCESVLEFVEEQLEPKYKDDMK